MTGAIEGQVEAKYANFTYVALFSPTSKSFSFSGQSDENNQ
jgi:hypothetical protein